MKRKILFNSVLNIAATTVPIFVIQFILYPFIARKLGNAEYGLMITMVSLFTVISHPYGNVLNNIRLLENNKYKNNNVEGDFNILLFVGLIINSLVMIAGTIYYEGKFSLISIILSILVSGLNLAREYFIVSFRINLNYKSILLNNVFLVLGYLVGFVVFYAIRYWQLIYLCGYIVSMVYIIKNSTLVNERFVITPIFKDTLNGGIILFFSTLLRSIITYADKLVIYPLLGPVAVSIYYTATILGKIISMGMNPISSVLLSYLPNIKMISLKNFFKILSYISIVGFIGYWMCIFISKPLLMFLYPEWANKSMDLIYITTASAIVMVMCTIIDPIILRYNNMNWQLVLSITEFATYIILTIALYKFYGLKGFCLGILITNVLKLFMMILIYVSKFRVSKQSSL